MPRNPFGQPASNTMKTMKGLPSILAIVTTLILLANPAPARAEIIFPFELDSMMDAEAIVRGKLQPDGTLKIESVLCGPESTRQAKVDPVPSTYGGLAKAIGPDAKPLDVVAFLILWQHQLRPMYGEAGVVAFHDDAVYAYGIRDDRLRDPNFSRRHGWTPESFLKQLDDAIAVRRKIDAVAAQPRGEARAAELIDLLMAHGKLRAEPAGYRFPLYRIAAAFRPVDEREQAHILERLKRADNAQKPRLLGLIAEIPLKPDAFDALVPLIDRTRPEDVRHMAIFAMAAVDQSATNERVLPLLTLDDPQVYMALSNLRVRDGQQNVRTVHALLRLSAQLVNDPPAQRRLPLWNLLGPIRNNMHPRLVEPLYQFAWDKHEPNRDASFQLLQDVTGMTLPREKADQWATWWAKAAPVLAANYDLWSAQGRRAWCKAANAADPGTRKILLRLWYFERDIHEKDLLALATGPDLDSAAIETLMDQWRVDRISLEAQRRLFDVFYSTELVQAPSDPKLPDYRTVYIYGKSNAAFPKELNIDVSCSIRLNGEPGEPQPSVAGQIATYDARFNIGSLSMNAPGPQVAKAIVVLRRLDYANGKKELWSIQRQLKPLTLRQTP